MKIPKPSPEQQQTLNYIQALDDPRLLLPSLGVNLASWKPWRTFHKAAHGLALDDPGELELFQKCTGRELPPLFRASEVYGIVGRRGGKSINIAREAVFTCLVDKFWQPTLAPGERGYFLILATDKIQSRIIMGYVKGIIRENKLFCSQVERETEEEIFFRNGAVVSIRAANFRSIRGMKIIGCACDELSYWRSDETSANPAKEILDAIRPGLVPGAILFGISSAYARQGVLYDEWMAHWGRTDDETLVWVADTRTMNPIFSQKKIDNALAADRAVAMSEYFSSWRDDLQGLYSSESVDMALRLGGDIPFGQGIQYRAFVDPSGGRRDSAALAIAHRNEKGHVVVDFMTERKAPHDPHQVAAAFAEVLKSYQIFSVTGDRYGGSWPETAYKEHGIRYEQADMTASELYLAALPLFSAGSVELPRSDRLRGQLCSLLRKTSTGGRDQVIAGQSDSSHADLANAVIGAVMLAAKRGASIGFEEFIPDDDDEPAPAEPSGLALLRHLLNGGK